MTDALARLAVYGREHPRLSQVWNLLGEGHMVGGCVRDALLGVPIPADYDFIVPSGAARYAAMVADRLGASFVSLDAARGMARVVLPGEPAEVYDFADYQRATLEADLWARDFTINAMAVAVASMATAPLQSLELIDPCGGYADLRNGIIRCPTLQVLDEDPLRLLRAVRFAASLGFRMHPTTRDALRPRAALLTHVAGERCRDELFKILESPGVVEAVRLMCGTELLESIGVPHPEDAPSRLLALQERVLPAGLAALERPQDLEAHLAAWLVPGRSRHALCRFCLLLVSATSLPPAPASVMEACCRLRLAHSEEALVLTTATSPVPDGGNRDIRRFFRERRDRGIESLLVAMTLSPAAIPRASAMLRWYFSEERLRSRPLLDGNEILALTGLPRGPRIGDLLELLADAQAEGEVMSRADAEAFVRAQSGHSP